MQTRGALAVLLRLGHHDYPIGFAKDQQFITGLKSECFPRSARYHNLAPVGSTHIDVSHRSATTVGSRFGVLATISRKAAR